MELRTGYGLSPGGVCDRATSPVFFSLFSCFQSGYSNECSFVVRYFSEFFYFLSARNHFFSIFCILSYFPTHHFSLIYFIFKNKFPGPLQIGTGYCSSRLFFSSVTIFPAEFLQVYVIYPIIISFA